jgi:hypothetical protein
MIWMLTALLLLGGLAWLARRAWVIHRRDAETIRQLIEENRARPRPGMAARDAWLMAQAETRARSSRSLR